MDWNTNGDKKFLRRVKRQRAELPVAHRVRFAQLSLEPLEDRRMLSATVDPAYADVAGILQGAISNGGFVVDPGNYAVTTVDGVDPQAANIDQGGEIETQVGVDSLDDSVLQAIANAGGRTTGTDPYSMAVNAWVHPADVAALAQLADVTSVTLPVLATSNAGQVDSTGNDALRASLADLTPAGLAGINGGPYGFGGTGPAVKVGVISVGAAHYGLSVASGDLPNVPNAITFDPSLPGTAVANDEGTAMMEIVHDMAPSASLYFAGGLMSGMDFASAVNWMRTQHVDVIVDDLTFYAEPWFTSGAASSAEQNAVQAGVTCITSAGNFAQRHFLDNYVQGPPAVVNGTSGNFDNFGTNKDAMPVFIAPGEKLTAFMQWSDAWNGSTNGYSVNLYDSNGNQLSASTSHPVAGSPLQEIDYTNTLSTTQLAFLQVFKPTGAAQRKVEIFIKNDDITIADPALRTPGMALIVQEAAPGVLAIGAADSQVNPTTVEAFSSQGPALLCTDFSSSPQVFTTVNNLAGIGVDNVTTYIGEQNYFENPFKGTSAAAPGVAGIAALLIQERKEESIGTSPAEIATVLENTAVDIPPTGYDQASGFGRFDALNALSAPALVNSGANLPNSTNAQYATFKGIGPAGSTVELYEDGSPAGFFPGSGVNNVYTINASLALSSGTSHTAYAVFQPNTPDLYQTSTTNFTADTTSPNFNNFATVQSSPRNKPLDSIVVAFTKPVYQLPLADFALADGGTPVALTAAQTPYPTSNFGIWVVPNLTSLTGVYGKNWTLSLASGAGIYDAAGNLLTGPLGTPAGWQMIPWQNDSYVNGINQSNVNDVNNNGSVSAEDLLQILNFFNLPANENKAAIVLQPPTNFNTAPPAPYNKYLDVNGDNFATASDALDVINYLLDPNGVTSGQSGSGGAAVTGPAAAIRLAAVDMTGQPITSIGVGQSFQVQEYVTDTSAIPQGVVAAYNDLIFNPSQVQPTGTAVFPPNSNITVVDASRPGVLDAGDVLQTTAPANPAAEQLLFTAKFIATAAGPLSISTAQDGGAGQDTLEFGSNDPVPAGNISYGSPLNLTVNSAVTGRNLFYAGSSHYDVAGGINGQTQAFSDDNAIAIDKTAYLPNGTQSNYSNISNYDAGINGIMVDIMRGANQPAITVSDFIFRVGNNNSPDTWATAPAPSSVSVRLGDGVGGSDRVELIWANNAIQQKWIEVTVLATADTGLATNDVFFFGSEIGNTGSSDTANIAITTATDVADIVNHGANSKDNIPITDIYDLNKDGLVAVGDVSDAVNHGTNIKNGLVFIDITAS